MVDLTSTFFRALKQKVVLPLKPADPALGQAASLVTIYFLNEYSSMKWIKCFSI